MKIKKWLCFLGVHDYQQIAGRLNDLSRQCSRCGRQKSSEVDEGRFIGEPSFWEKLSCFIGWHFYEVEYIPNVLWYECTLCGHVKIICNNLLSDEMERDYNKITEDLRRLEFPKDSVTSYVDRLGAGPKEWARMRKKADKILMRE